MWKELIILLAISFTVASSAKTQCKHDSECGTGECCYYHEGPMVMSKKRQVSLLPFREMVQGGWCERYKQHGEHCSGISKMNGHCECAPGLKCTWIPDPTLGPLILQTLPTISINVRSLRPGGHSECR